jgi:glycine/D-amino acid oxidase-like deaminating enzyme
VESAAGLRAARSAWKASRRSASEFATLLRHLKIRCDLVSQPLTINARQQPDLDGLKREQFARKGAGLDAPWLSSSAAAADLGTDSVGAIRLKDGFLYDPVRATLGLAAAAALRGARIHEQSPVKRTRFNRKDAQVVLASGTIQTRYVFVATGAPGPVFGQLERHVEERLGYVVVTEPLSAAMRREVGKRASLVTEYGDRPHWLRWLADDRAMFAGGVSKPVGRRQLDRAVVAHTADLMYAFSVRYPAISGLPARWGSSVPIITTGDGLPWIGAHRNYPFHFFAIAFGWHGDGLALFAAKAALRAFSDESTSEDRAFGFAR